MSLCYRCEHRAQFNESERRPRYECGDTKMSVCGCYMYKPVRPVILEKDKDDIRPQFGPQMISARSRFKGVADSRLSIVEQDGGKVLYWTPTNHND